MMRRACTIFRRPLTRLAAAVFLCALAPAAGTLHAQYRMDLPVSDGPPVPGPNPTITPHPNAQIPFDAEFTSSEGTAVKLGDLFNHNNKPVVIEMVYFNCPFLCGENQKTLALRIRDGVRSLRLGEDYDVLIVSIDPDDTPAQAAVKRANYLSVMDRPASQKGVTYLTGTEPNIRKLADAIGFGYRRQFAGDKYLHSTGLFVSTSFGRISQTIVKLDYTSDELHAALLQAADNKIGSGILETVALPCGAMRLNPNTGRYEQNPWFWAGTAGGLASLAFMSIFLGVMWRGEFKRKRAGEEPPAAPPAANP